MIRRVLLCIDTLLICLAIIVAIDYSNYIANIKYVNNTKTVILDNVINMNIENKNIVIDKMEYSSPKEIKFKIENLSDQKTNFNILFKNIVNDFDNELVYELYEADKLSVSQTIAPKTGGNNYIKIGVDLAPAEQKEYTMKFELLNRKNEDINNYSDKKFIAYIDINSLTIKSEIKTATNYLIANNIVNETDEVDGLIKTTDTDSGQASYYFKGNVSNNYVKFNDQLWRIVRINENGSIRIIKDDNLQSNIVYNDLSNDENSNNYMNSNVKNELDKYYNDNIKKYGNMLSSEAYCTTTTIVRNDNYKTSDNDKNYQEYIPSLKCGDNYKSMIGLISYNEASLIGLKSFNSPITYLNDGDNKQTWTMTKAGINNYTQDRYMWYIDNNLKDTLVTNNSVSIRPVINLKASLNLIGNGTLENPYIFSE